MSAVYELVNDFPGASAGEFSVNPYWILAIVRLDDRFTFSRRVMTSIDKDVSTGARVRADTLVIAGDCTALTIQNGKAEHTKSLQATMANGEINYLSAILPGDWVLAWIVNDRATALDLVGRIKKGDPCNKFMDGFKFLGRAQSVRKSLVKNPGDGTLSVSYLLSASGFRELDTEIYYDQDLAEHDVEAGVLDSWLTKVGIDTQNLFQIEVQNGLQDNVHSIISTLLDIMVGRGLPQTAANVTGNTLLQAATGGVQSDDKEAPFGYLVPAEVGALINRHNPSKKGGILAYADILDFVFGVQAYPNLSSDIVAQPWGSLIPEIDPNNPLTTERHRFTSRPLMGSYLPLMPAFLNKPLWSVMQQYLNQNINEMYTCLRVDEKGDVVPTLVLRQKPFTTDLFAERNDGLDVDHRLKNLTKFSALPRWKPDPTMLFDVDIGRHDGLRFNFVHIYGQDSNSKGNFTTREQLVTHPPIRDDIDIQRSGLRPWVDTVACANKDTIGTVPRQWMELVADQIMAYQLALQGTFNSIGIQAPICEGDNWEFDGVLYHIEGITHSCSISNDGTKSFRTSVRVTNGLRAMQGTQSDEQIFPGLRDSDNTKYDPGLTYESGDTNPPDIVRGPETRTTANRLSKLSYGPSLTDAGLAIDDGGNARPHIDLKKGPEL